MIDSEDISQLLENWHNTKQEIASLEKKLEKYKKYADKILEHYENDTISSSEFLLRKSKIVRTSVGQKDLPKEIWNKYCKRTSYDAYYLTLKKPKVDKLLKSPKIKKRIRSPDEY